MGLDGCNPRFAETHRSPQHPGSAVALAGPCLQNHDGHQAGTTAPLSTKVLSTRTQQSPAGAGACAPRKVPRTMDDSALFDAFTMGLDGCNPRFAETHRCLCSTLGAPSNSASPCLQNHDGHQAGTAAPRSTHCLSTRTPQSPSGEGAGAPRKVPRTLDDSALFDAFTMGLDGCNPRVAETHTSLQHPGSA